MTDLLYNNMWKIVWSGGDYLSRFIKSHSGIVLDKTVLDIGTGTGIVAITSALAGAKKVYAWDMNPRAMLAVQENAAAYGVGDRVKFEPVCVDQTTVLPADIDIITAADTFYKDDADIIESLLFNAAQKGKSVLAASFESELLRLRSIGVDCSDTPASRQKNVYVRMVAIHKGFGS